jgi:hypothetical protein
MPAGSTGQKSPPASGHFLPAAKLSCWQQKYSAGIRTPYQNACWQLKKNCHLSFPQPQRGKRHLLAGSNQPPAGKISCQQRKSCAGRENFPLAAKIACQHDAIMTAVYRLHAGFERGVCSPAAHFYQQNFFLPADTFPRWRTLFPLALTYCQQGDTLASARRRKSSLAENYGCWRQKSR